MSAAKDRADRESVRRPRRTPDVLLVSMPFGPAFFPSLGLSLLRGELARAGIDARIRYETLRFASLIGEPAYSGIAMTGEISVVELAGEWVFSDALFERESDGADRYVAEILDRRAGSVGRKPPVGEQLRRRILRARSRASAYLDATAQRIARARPRVVGFTSVFQQHVASLALAKRIKRLRPHTFVMMGGANCEGSMGEETIRQFPFVDAVVSGEGERVIVPLVRAALEGRAVDDLTGVYTAANANAQRSSNRLANAPVVTDMDALPVPDFDDFVHQFRRSRLGGGWDHGVLVETSRGCWWGERSHCTFCGLNGATLRYRSKSPKRALDELETLAARHPGVHIQVVDNILDLSYFKTLLPELARRRLDFSLFYETKSNLKKDQVQLLGRAGVHHIQPGIESFSDPVLKLMRKGVSALHNVQLLKWCKQFGVTPLWNLLWGFPGEPPEEYRRMAALVPMLTHLEAPVGVFGLRLDRFSPSFDHAEAMGFREVAPLPAYRHVYDLPDRAIANLAYYFGYAYADAQEPGAYTRDLASAIEEWRAVSARSDLFFADVDQCLLVWDLRPGARRALTVLEGADRAAYLACDGVRELTQIERSMVSPDLEGAEAAAHGPLPGAPSRSTATAPQAGALVGRLDALAAAGLMLKDGTRYLSLALPLSEYEPPATIVRRFDDVALDLGRATPDGIVIRANGRTAASRARLRDGAERKRGPAPRGRRRSLDAGRFMFNRHGDLVIR